MTTTRFGEGSALLADVLQSQAALAAANDQYQGAVLAFWSARADFERALGEAPMSGAFTRLARRRR